MKSSTKHRKPSKPAASLPAGVRVKYFMGKSHVVADVTEPNGTVHEWVLPVDIVPKSERPDIGALKFLSGDHVLYQEQRMPKPVEVPFYKLLKMRKK